MGVRAALVSPRFQLASGVPQKWLLPRGLNGPQGDGADRDRQLPTWCSPESGSAGSTLATADRPALGPVSSAIRGSS